MSDLRVVRSVLVATSFIGFASSGRCEDPPRSPWLPADRATVLMQREARRAANARDAALVRLRQLPQVEIKVKAGDRLALRRRDEVDGEGTTLVTAQIQPIGLDGRPDLEAEPRIEVLEASFDLSVFGSTGDKASASVHLNSLLNRTIGNIEGARERPLVGPQKSRLLLAGRGDIKRLFERIEEARKEFNTLKGDVSRCEEFLSSLLPLSRELRRGPFNRADSLLQKMLRRIDGTLRVDSATR